MCEPKLAALRTPARTPEAINYRLRARIEQLPGRKPVRASKWSAQENRFMEQHVRALARGRFANAMAAARACCEALGRLRRGPGTGRRSVLAVYVRLRPRARQLGVLPTKVRWSPEEEVIATAWAARYWRLQGDFPPWSKNEMASLMMTELKAKGYRRSYGTCRLKLLSHIRRMADGRVPRPWPAGW